jgi:hypothetical protein
VAAAFGIAALAFSSAPATPAEQAEAAEAAA